MKTRFARRAVRLACGASAAFLAFGAATSSHAQMGGNNPTMMQNSNQGEERLFVGTADTEADRQQGSAYNDFLKERDAAKKIKLGNDFLGKYPKSALAERVDVGMMDVYRARQDWKDAYLWADNALALEPDDVDVLSIVGWTIPHVYSPDDANADQELDTAEKYAKHALEVMARMPKPSGMNDAQFVAAKSRRTFQAHSALGLVYFRREDYANSASELDLATKGNPVRDQTDLFVLGVDLQNLKRYSEAADSFRACSEAPGPLQSQCKDNATTASAQALATQPK